MSKEAREINFDYLPYMSKVMLDTFENLLLDIQDIIHDGLKDYPNFLGVQFIDVSAGGIQIRGFHKQVSGHSYGKQVTIKYDMSNAYDCADAFIEGWKASDTDKAIKATLSFIKEGEEYGWD